MLSGETLVRVLGLCHNVWQWYSVGRQYEQWLTNREERGQVDCDCNLMSLKESIPLCEIQLTPKGQHKAFSSAATIQSPSTVLPLHRSSVLPHLANKPQRRNSTNLPSLTLMSDCQFWPFLYRWLETGWSMWNYSEWCSNSPWILCFPVNSGLEQSVLYKWKRKLDRRYKKSVWSWRNNSKGRSPDWIHPPSRSTSWAGVAWGLHSMEKWEVLGWENMFNKATVPQIHLQQFQVWHNLEVPGLHPALLPLFDANSSYLMW